MKELVDFHPAWGMGRSTSFVLAATLAATLGWSSSFALAQESPAESARAQSAASDPSGPPAISPTPNADLAEPVWTDGLEAGLAAAQASGKPAFVVAGGTNCPWCRRLEAELALPELAEELRRWQLIHVDVDDAPADARRLGVGPIPALRLMRPSGTAIASQEGYIPAETLRAWLAEHRSAAGAAIDPALVAAGEPDAQAVVRLVGLLSQRDPLLRDAAIKRLAAAPRLAAPALVERLREGKLADRLAALEVFASWSAPVEALDPWRPETIDAGALEALDRWSDERRADDAASEQVPFDEEDAAEVGQEIDRLLRLDLTAGAPLRARLARYGSAALPIVHARLEQAATKEDREKLLALRYRLVASDSLALRDPASLSSLAADDAMARRRAAENVAALAGPADQGLLLELFGDPDPLVRETALRGIERLDDGAASEALVDLLDDPEPNVRAAVLKRLAEEAPPTLVPDVAAYVRTEADPDLLVHAIRYLRQAGGGAAVDAVAPLLDHRSWQVRAEAVETLGVLVDSSYQAERPEKAADVVARMIERLKDEDPFVVSRAATALEDSGPLALGPMLDAAERLPDIAPAIIAAAASNHADSPLLARRLAEFAKHEQASVRAAAYAALLQSSSDAATELAAAGLSDADPAIRRDVALGVSRKLDEALDSARYEAVDRFASATENRTWDWDRTLRKLKAEPATKRWAALEAPLRAMLSSEDASERQAAAFALARLGSVEEAEPFLAAGGEYSDETWAAAAGLVRWAPGDNREHVFESLLAAAGTTEQRLAILIHATGQVYDQRTPELLWTLTRREDLTPRSASALFDALGDAYFGDLYSYEQADPEQKRALIEAAEERLDGSEFRRLIALCLLAHVDAEKAKEAARRFADDAATAESLRRDAFQVLLALEPDESERSKLAAEAFAGKDVAKRRVALEAFVHGPEQLAYLREYAFRVPAVSSNQDAYSREPGPIVPAAPEGMSVESLRAFEAATDDERAQVGYLLALSGDRGGLETLLQVRGATGGVDSQVVSPQMTYRAIARLDAGDRLDVLREIYASLDAWSRKEFYWTVRIMTGEPVLQFRKEMRDELGPEGLR